MANNGKPITILTSIDADPFERSLRDIRQFRANAALADLQRDAAVRGLDNMSPDEIAAEIQASRERRDRGLRS